MENFIERNTPKNKILFFILLDILSIHLASFMALFVRFDFSFMEIPVIYLENILKYSIINTIITIIIFIVARLYKSVWRYASINELAKIIVAGICAAFVQLIGMNMFKISMPRSYDVLYMFFLIVFTCCTRFAYRILMVFQEKKLFLDDKNKINVMLIGAGAAGNAILKEVQESPYLKINIKCIIDDNQAKWGKYLKGVQIVGGRKDIIDNVEKFNINEIIIAMPSAGSQNVRDILNICKETGCKMRIMPGIYQLINGEISVSKLREVEIEDLLGRDPIKINLNEIMGYVKDKVVLVTGGGGSIGSELCRQIAQFAPKQLIIFDIYENNAYEIQQELVRTYPDLNFEVLIGSVRNTHRINSVFEKYRPDIVYHAAAHKHVPLMEDSPNEAIKNNVFGTLKTATAAGEFHVQKFVLISTDKAVNPTNIMGASKRICEMLIQSLNNNYDTEYVAVRFGNVLGSNGSVIPLFKNQIAEGGPVTVTHPDIIRYFMTIPEAVSLVLQAGAYAHGGEIFVLDMGEPVRILDLAKNLIKLSGYKLNDDIKIKFTGLRPGEKLYEELLMDEEGLQCTENQRIHIGKPIEFDEKNFMEQLKELEKLSNEDSESIKIKVQEIVSTYKVI